MLTKEISPYFLAKAIKILIICLLNPACIFIYQTTIIQYIMTYNNELKIRRTVKILV